MSDTPPLWPVACCNCGEQYAAFRVYARWGRERREFPMCALCGPALPSWVEGRFDEVWHTILRPVPEGLPRPARPGASESISEGDTH